MSDTIQGMFYFVILMVLVFAASRVMARFTGAKFSNALAPLVPVIGGTSSTDSLTSGWLEGAYQNRKVTAVSIPASPPTSMRARRSGTTPSRWRCSTFPGRGTGA